MPFSQVKEGISQDQLFSAARRFRNSVLGTSSTSPEERESNKVPIVVGNENEHWELWQGGIALETGLNPLRVKNERWEFYQSAKDKWYGCARKWPTRGVELYAPKGWTPVPVEGCYIKEPEDKDGLKVGMWCWGLTSHKAKKLLRKDRPDHWETECGKGARVALLRPIKVGDTVRVVNKPETEGLPGGIHETIVELRLEHSEGPGVHIASPWFALMEDIRLDENK